MVLRFGEVAVALGYVSANDVRTALAVQRLDRRAGRPHRRVGQILVSLGRINERQISEVLDAMIRENLRQHLACALAEAAP